MASANPGKVTFISYKLTFLKEQKDRLINAIGLYVSRMIAEGESWKQGGDNPTEYQELCQKIDTAVEFLCEKCEELTVRVAENPRSSEQPGLRSQSVTPTTTTTSAASYRQHTSPPDSTATTSYRQSAESLPPVDESQLRSLLAKIAVIEEALCSFRSRTEKVSKQQSGIEQQLEELLSKVSESDKKNSSRFKQVKQQISDTQSAIEQEQTSLQSLEKQLQKISTEQNRLKVKVESQAETVAKLVHVPNQLVCVKENVDAIEESIDRIISDCGKKHEEIDTEMRDLAGKVTANIDQLQSESKAQKTTLPRELEIRLQALEADGGTTVKEVQKQAEKSDEKFQILCQIVSDRLRPLEQLRASFNERASVREDNVTKLTQVIKEVADMSPRLHQLELNSSGTVCGFSAHKWITHVAQDTVTQYKIKYSNVGQNFDADSGIFTAPIDGLYVTSISLWLSENEELRAGVRHKLCLDQTASTFVCRVLAEAKDTSSCSVGVIDMKAEMNSPGTSRGFSAQTWFTGEAKREETPNTIKQYKVKFSSVGKNFNSDTGIFTAPVDGLYVACISLCLSEDEELQVAVKHKHKSGHIPSASVCESLAAQKGTTACGIGVVGMKAGDMVFSCVNHMDKNDHDKMVFFSCFLLG